MDVGYYRIRTQLPEVVHSVASVGVNLSVWTLVVSQGAGVGDPGTAGGAGPFIALTGHICHVNAMNFDAFLRRVPPEGVFRTGQILAGERSPDHVRRQLHRWSRQGRIIKLRRGVYMLGERNTGRRPHPFVIANYLKTGSYISLQSALSHYGMIPEYVPVITSVTTGRPETLHNEAGHFQFRHIDRRLFRRFDSLQLGDEQHAFVATPEKALLDLLYLTADSDNIAYLQELRVTPPESLGTEGVGTAPPGHCARIPAGANPAIASLY